MQDKISVEASIYRLEQDVNTRVLSFYMYHNVIKTLPCDHLCTMPELFDKLCDLCSEHKREEM